MGRMIHVILHLQTGKLSVGPPGIMHPLSILLLHWISTQANNNGTLSTVKPPHAYKHIPTHTVYHVMCCLSKNYKGPAKTTPASPAASATVWTSTTSPIRPQMSLSKQTSGTDCWESFWVPMRFRCNYDQLYACQKKNMHHSCILYIHSANCI